MQAYGGMVPVVIEFVGERAVLAACGRRHRDIALGGVVGVEAAPGRPGTAGDSGVELGEPGLAIPPRAVVLAGPGMGVVVADTLEKRPVYLDEVRVISPSS